MAAAVPASKASALPQPAAAQPSVNSATKIWQTARIKPPLEPSAQQCTRMHMVTRMHMNVTRVTRVGAHQAAACLPPPQSAKLSPPQSAKLYNTKYAPKRTGLPQDDRLRPEIHGNAAT